MISKITFVIGSQTIELTMDQLSELKRDIDMFIVCTPEYNSQTLAYKLTNNLFSPKPDNMNENCLRILDPHRQTIETMPLED